MYEVLLVAGTSACMFATRYASCEEMRCGQCTYIDHLLSSHGQLLLTPEQKDSSPGLAHPPLTQIYYSSLDHPVMHRDCPMIRANSPGGEPNPLCGYSPWPPNQAGPASSCRPSCTPQPLTARYNSAAVTSVCSRSRYGSRSSTAVRSMAEL